ncbi:LysR substrate-binding domain-containing protein [uncultured Kiloniella sp.]|uniref:LysR substrate-binding domain-containing protein n=1 Tax=uncultured Kiloniella sp. TaxID=1133091 RepID=UPI0026047BA0|nr:LysR substrate-binding domain-containing protein [uncultured Kiloniella sp.]
MRDFPSLSSLRAFEAVVRHHNLSHAAKELNVTHAAVAQQIKRLEEWFGATLTQREGRGVVPTEAGFRLGAELSKSFDIIDDAVKDLKDSMTDRPLRITMTPTFVNFWLMPRLGDFRKRHPDVEILLNANSDVVDLRRDDYDLAIRYGTGNWPSFQVEKLMPSYTSIVVSPELIENIQIKSPKDLTKLPWVCDIDDRHSEWHFWLKQHEIDFHAHHAKIHLSGYLTKDAIRDGQGLGVLPSNWVQDDIKSGQLVELFSLTSNENTGYHLVYKQGVIPSHLKKFLTWIRKQNKATPI